MAVYKLANKASVDFIGTGNMFFNAEYARSHAPGSRCYDPEKIVENLDEITIGADMFCGSWSANKNFLGLIYYPENVNEYLVEAASLGYTRIVEYFITEKNAEIDGKVKGSTPLHIAIQNGHIDIVDYLLAHGAHVEIKAVNDLTALSIAVQSKHHEIVELILKYHPDIEVKFPSGATPLYVAVYLGDSKTVQLLLKNGANKNVKINGVSMEQMAISNGYQEIVQMLRADIEPTTTGNLDQQLIEAVKADDFILVWSLIERGVNVDAVSDTGEAPLYLATLKGDINIVKLLLKSGANTEIASAKGHTPLYVAIYLGNIAVVELLLKNGASVEDNINIWTPMIISTAKGYAENAPTIGKEIYKLVQDYYWRDVEEYQQITSHSEVHRSFEVVVARCNEDISWLLKEFPSDKVTIYNKCGSITQPLPDNYQVIDLPNIGRESHSYLTHIIKHYDTLADRVLFLQGYPYDHLVYLPLAFHKEDMDLKCSSLIAKCEEYTIKDLDRMTRDFFGNNEHGGKYNNVLERGFGFLEFIDKFICKYPLDTSLFISWGAQFAIDAETIKNHEIGYYQNILDVLDVQSPIESHYLETLWSLVFEQCPYEEIV